MNLRELFFGDAFIMRPSEVGIIIRESLPGLIIVLLTGFTAYFLSNTTKFGLAAIPFIHYIDGLVLAVFLGMLVRIVFKKTGTLVALTPGIILAPLMFIPIGIILYGMSFRIDQLSQTHPTTLGLVLGFMIASCILIYIIAVRVFGLSKKLGQLLGVGSAVCGASAIAISSAAVKAEPDEMGTALVTNTVLALISLAILKSLTMILSPEIWATTAGAFLQQTGFVKIAVVGELQKHALLIKTTRVALLILIVPILYYINRRQFVIPWYLLGFIGVGFWYSYAAPGKAVTDFLKLFHTLLFTTAIAGIGMNADLLNVFKRLWKPLIITTSVFIVGVGLFVWIVR